MPLTVNLPGGNMSLSGPVQNSGDVRFRAAVRGMADIKCVLVRSVLINQYIP